MNGTKWAPLSKETSLWGKRKKHYVSAGSGIAKLADDEDAFSDEPALADGFISELNRRYEFRGGLVLEDFLRGNSYLGRPLLEASEVIRSHFGFGTRLALEVVADPEAPGDQQVFVVIRTRFRPKIARALLSDLDRRWWRDALSATQGKMELAVE